MRMILQGAIDLMMTIYKQMLPELGGYLTRGAQVDLKKVEQFIRKIGSFEDVIFQKRMRLLSRYDNGWLRSRGLSGQILQRCGVYIAYCSGSKEPQIPSVVQIGQQRHMHLMLKVLLAAS
jgi:hypothetical protein